MTSWLFGSVVADTLKTGRGMSLTDAENAASLLNISAVLSATFQSISEVVRLRNLTEARQAKVQAEFIRGQGNRVPYQFPVNLEPPFVPYEHGRLNNMDVTFLGLDGPFEPNPIKRFFQGLTAVSSEITYLPPEYKRKDLMVVRKLALPAQLDSSPQLAEQFLVGMTLSDRASFELIGTKDGITLQMTCERSSVGTLTSQLETQYPQLSIQAQEDDLMIKLIDESSDDSFFYFAEYGLKNTHCYPILTFSNWRVDPLLVAIGALSGLKGDDWGLLQILWHPVEHNWAQNMHLASRNEFDQSKPAFYDFPDLKACSQKLARPLFAVSVRAAGSQTGIVMGLEGFLQQFGGSYNGFVRCPEEDFDSEDALVRGIESVCDRMNFRFGMIFNSEELAGLVHLPSREIVSKALPRQISRTAPAPVRVQGNGIIIGENIYRGLTTKVAIPQEMRNQHTYLIGATRTGKTTLMLNMILQDIQAGAGLAVVDPHGDLIREEILPRIPANRVSDVVYFNPDDRDFPIAFNVLQSGSHRDKELLCNDLIVVFQRLFGESWGMRLEHILRYLILTLLEHPGSTLRDIRRLLDNEAFRFELIPKVTDPEVRDFWDYEFASHNEHVFSPIRNKLGKFLAYPTIRNMILQPETKIDFGEIMDSGKILLCNLSQGQLGEEVSNILGALLVSRLQIAAMGRAGRQMHERRNFYLYVDEFQNYITSSFEKILSEASKYRLNLTLANQFLKQLPEKLQSAILDNVGTLLCFRTGTDVATRLAKELGEFTVQDISNLGRGEVIARVGSSHDTFNLRTFLPPDKPSENHVQSIIEYCRKHYATPRAEVESKLQLQSKGPKLESMDDFYE